MKNQQDLHLYAKLRTLCKERNMTIAELERKAGLGNGVIRKWDRASPTLRTVGAVADCLGVTINELLAMNFD